MRNMQSPERLEIPDGSRTLDVHSKWNTIQGEGLFAGTPASFIRLAGCNLQCPLCDTDYTKGRRREEISSLLGWVKNQPHGLVVLTGGEPFRQDIFELVNGIGKLHKILQIETNGTYIPLDFPQDKCTVICSPKNSNLSSRTSVHVHAWKYVVRHDAIDPFDGLPTSALGMSSRPARPNNQKTVYVQPCDDKDPLINRLNTEAAVKSCMQFGYRLCLQIQKIINMP